MQQGSQSTRFGEWLFRWRSYLPLALIALVLPAFNGFHYPDGLHDEDLEWEMLCLAVSLFGMMIRICTVGYTPSGTSGRNTAAGQIADTLNTTGMYSITRNPLYLGNFFMTLGGMMFIRVWWVCLIYALVFYVYYGRIILAEENFLQAKYGSIYREWRRRTPEFIPNPALWKPNVLPFSLRNVLKREYPGFFGIITTFALLDIVGDYVIEGHLEFDPVWMTLFVIALLVRVILRSLKKYTAVLNVEGR